jgi:hypothetical protein
VKWVPSAKNNVTIGVGIRGTKGGLEMPYLGHFEKGIVVMDESVVIPEGTRVKVEPLDSGESEEGVFVHPALRRFVGIIPEEIEAREEHARHISEQRQ